MREDIARFLMEVPTYFVVLPVLFALVRVRYGNEEQKVLSVLIFISLVVEHSSIFVSHVLKSSNLPLLHIFTILEFGLIAYLFKNSINAYWSEKKLYWVIGLFSIFSILNTIFHETIFQFNAYARAVEALLIILLALLYFFSTLKSMEEKNLERSPIFWVSSGVLLYFSSSLFIFIYSNILFGEGKDSYTIWGLHAIMSIVLYIFYTIALWVKPKT